MLDSRGGGRWAEITVRAEAASPRVVATGGAPQGLQPVAAAVEQFDLQPLDGVMVAYDTGWHEAEFDPMRGLSWRWASDAATLRVWSGGQDVEVTLRAESPRRVFRRRAEGGAARGRSDARHDVARG